MSNLLSIIQRRQHFDLFLDKRLDQRVFEVCLEPFMAAGDLNQPLHDFGRLRSLPNQGPLIFA